jgi:hypothetical protein
MKHIYGRWQDDNRKLDSAFNITHLIGLLLTTPHSKKQACYKMLDGVSDLCRPL